jgi:hypothetical protein
VIETKQYVRDVFTANGYKPFYTYLHTREWISEDGAMIVDGELKEYDWRWTGQFNTYIGKHKSILSRLAKRGKKSDQQKAEISSQIPEIDCPF